MSKNQAPTKGDNQTSNPSAAVDAVKAADAAPVFNPGESTPDLKTLPVFNPEEKMKFEAAPPKTKPYKTISGCTRVDR